MKYIIKASKFFAMLVWLLCLTVSALASACYIIWIMVWFFHLTAINPFDLINNSQALFCAYSIVPTIGLYLSTGEVLDYLGY